MDFETARRVYNQIETTKSVRSKRQMLTLAVRYARVRTDWHLASPDERREMDRHRSQAHDALIDACNILSRHMAEAGEDNSWRAALEERKDIGDFACYIHCFLGLGAR